MTAEDVRSRLRCPHCHRLFESTGKPDTESWARNETVHMEPGAPPTRDSEDGSLPVSQSRQEVHAPAATAEGREVVASTRLPGETFGGYQIVREIARGGMGIVYLAREHKLRRTVALKVLRAGEGASDEDLHRFLREAEAAASLAHPNIVPIHELDVNEGTPFFTMDYIEGPSLEMLIGEGQLTIRRSVEILEEVALAIHYAHSKGIVHRDLKPGNVIIAPDGSPMLTDFGLAVNLTQDREQQRLTHSGVVMGTIPYIPPEQAAGRVEQCGPHSDIYSLGAVLYEMITGKAPFEGQTQFELLHAVLHREPPPPRRINPRIPPDLQTICLKCLEKPAWRRYRTAEELAADCRAWLNGEMIRARPATFWYRGWRLLSRHRTLSWGALGMAVLVLAFFRYASSLHGETEKKEQEKARIEEAFHLQVRKVEKLQAEKEELTASLDRGWRAVLFEPFRKLNRSRWLIAPGRVTFARGAYVILGKGRRGADPPAAETVDLALKEDLPGDIQLECDVYTPKKNGAAVGVLISGHGLSLAGSSGYLFRIGPPAEPGAYIVKGPVTLASKSDVVLRPDKWERLRVERNGTRLSLLLNGTVVLEAVDETPIRSDENGAAGFVAANGLAYLDDVRVFRPGASQQMLANMLDMADEIYRSGRAEQLNWATAMAENVAEEGTDPVLHLRALGRCVACYMRLHRNHERARRQLDQLIQRLERSSSYQLQPGEREYLYGMLASEAREFATAVRQFDEAAAVLGLLETETEAVARFPLLAHLEGILARIRQGEVTAAVQRLTAMQRETRVLSQIATTCRDELQAGDMHVIFLAEVDRLLEAGEADSVWVLLEALAELFPSSGRDLAARCLALSRLYEERGGLEEALDRVQAAAALDPEWVDPLLARAAFHHRQGEVDAALEILRRAAAAFPEEREAHVALARFLLEELPYAPEVLAEAEGAAERAIELTGHKDPAVLELKARICVAGGRTAEAVSALQEAQELDLEPKRARWLQELLPALDIPATVELPAGPPPADSEPEDEDAGPPARREVILTAPRAEP